MRNDPRSHGLWETTAPHGPQYPILNGTHETEVAIIGAGYTGLSTALHLSEAGMSATVIDAVEPGFGGAGRNVGLVNAGMWVMPKALPDVLGPVYGQRLLEFLGDAPSEVFSIVRKYDIDCEAVPNGTLHLAVGKAGLLEITEREAQWKACGAPVKLLDATETRRRLGGGNYRGALLDCRAGTIQPLSYARGLAQAAMSHGATIYANTPATKVARENGVWVVTTPNGTLRARWLIPASDAYTQNVFPEISREQVTLPYFNMATTPLPKDIRETILPNGEGCWDTREVLSSYRMDRSGRLIFGSVGRLGAVDFGAHKAWALRAMRRIFPQLKNIEFDHVWWGRIGMTSDHLPRLHKLGENALTFCGYNGRGIAPGTVFGKALAKHILGELPEGDMPLPPSDIRPAALRNAKYAFYAAGSALQHTVSDRL